MFLQANLQNILGKPKYQLINEQILNRDTIVLKRFYETDGFSTNLEKTQMISMLYEAFQDDIENMLTMKMLADCQFMDTVKIIRGLAIFYILCMVIPYLIQTYNEEPVTIMICLILMLLV